MAMRLLHIQPATVRPAILASQLVRRALPGALSVLTGLAALSCERAAPPPVIPPAARPAAPVQTYTVKGRVEQLPNPAVKGSMFQVHHEDIPGFVSREGKVIGMNAMTMPFPPAQGVSLDGLAVGDEIELTFEVRWDRMPPQQATVIKKQPRPPT